MIKLKHWRKYILFGILIVHGLWITHHLTLVAVGAVNPWKMGGYAMYTKPSKSSDVVINIIDQYDEEGGVSLDPFNSYIPFVKDFYRMNWDFNMYCKPITHDSIIQLFEDNPRFTNEDLLIEVYAYRLKSEPLRQITEKMSETKIFWQDNNHFSVSANVCGKSIPEKIVQYK